MNMRMLKILGMNSVNKAAKATYIDSLARQMGRGYVVALRDTQPCVQCAVGAKWQAKLTALGWTPTDMRSGLMEIYAAEIWARKDGSWPITIVPEYVTKKQTVPTNISLCNVDRLFTKKDAQQIARRLTPFGIRCNPDQTVFSKNIYKQGYVMTTGKNVLKTVAQNLLTKYEPNYIRSTANEVCLILLGNKLNVYIEKTVVRVEFRDF